MVVNNNMDNLPVYFRGKRLLVIGGGLVLLLLVLMVFSSRPKIQSQTDVLPTQAVQPTPDSNFIDSSQDSQSPEVQQAIADQMKADEEYGAWQDSNSTSYPWLRKLPLTSEKYFVYFDLTKKIFIGRLYIKSGDNIDQIKSDILKILKLDEEIPIENFKVEWMVNP